MNAAKVYEPCPDGVFDSLPFCAICRHAVDRISMWPSEWKECLVLKAECHGKTEMVELSRFALLLAPETEKVKLLMRFHAGADPEWAWWLAMTDGLEGVL